MKKRVFISIISIVSLALLASCSTLSSMVGLDGLAGFDKASQKALETGFTEIDWLDDEELKESLSAICENGSFSVSYSDRHRMLEFTAINSCLRVRAYNNRIELAYIDTVDYESILWGDGWFNPSRITFEVYGNKVSEEISRSEVERVNENYYNQLLKKTVYIQYEEVNHVLSTKAADFLNNNWSNNDLYITVNGGKRVEYRIKNADVINLYRTLYEVLYPYDQLATSSIDEITGFITDLSSISEEEAFAINYFLNMNEDLSKDQLIGIEKLINSRVR